MSHADPTEAPGDRLRPSPLRIVHVIEQLGVGGAERQLLGLLSRMDRRRFEHHVVYFRQSVDSLDGRFREQGIRTTHVPKAGVRPWVFFMRLRRLIRRESPDIVHTWLYSANFWGRWAAASCGLRRIAASDRAEVGPAGPLIRLHERLLRKRTVRLANSRAVAESLRRHHGLPEEHIRVIGNGVELPPCDRAVARREIRRELGLPEDHKLVVMVARQSREKNYPMFFRAGKRVAARRSDATFLAVGREDLKAELDPVLAALDAGDRVRIVGPRDDVPRWLAAADVFGFTSDHEGCPNSLLEAMMAGLPVVCTDFAAAGEVIGDEGAGIIVPRNDDAAMADAVAGLLDDPDRREKLGRRARERAERLFAWPAVVARMERLYAEMMEAA